LTNLQDIAKAFGIADPKDLNQNLQLRVLVNELANQDLEFRAEMREMALRDHHLMFNLFFWTYDPRQGSWHEPNEKPFITWDFQDKFLPWLLDDIIGPGKDCHIDKARDMGASWLAICAIIHCWLQPEPGNDFLLGSRKFEFVDKRGAMDTLIEKVRYIINRLPKWLLPEGYNSNKHDNIGLIRNPQTGSIIKGEANNANFGTGGRYKAMLFDEFSKWTETDAQAWTSGFQATKCRIALSTPWGTSDRKFHQLKTDEHIAHYTLNWWEHPHKDARWYAEEAKRCTPLEMAQEVDISYEGAAGKRFVTNYQPSECHLRPLEPIEYHEVIRLWDFGYHHPLCLFTQIQNDVRWFWLKVIVGKDVIASDFAKYVQERSEEWFPTCPEFVDIGDPAGNQVSDKSERSTIKLIQTETGIKIRTKSRGKKAEPVNVRRVQSAKRLQGIFGEFINGQPRILINEEKDDRADQIPTFIETQSMHYVHKALQGGLHYPMNDAYAEVYEKDGFFDHLGDVARYGVFYYFMKPMDTDLRTPRKAKEKQIIQERKLEVLESKSHGGNKDRANRTSALRQARQPASRAQVLGRLR
jgi:hypothetical protein